MPGTGKPPHPNVSGANVEVSTAISLREVICILMALATFVWNVSQKVYSSDQNAAQIAQLKSDLVDTKKDIRDRQADIDKQLRDLWDKIHTQDLNIERLSVTVKGSH